MGGVGSMRGGGEGIEEGKGDVVYGGEEVDVWMACEGGEDGFGFGRDEGGRVDVMDE